MANLLDLSHQSPMRPRAALIDGRGLSWDCNLVIEANGEAKSDA
jgi:hypothetical protein